MEEKIIGLDLSKHNGEVNFEELKENGIKFCILRLGFGNDEEFQDDTQFERNVAECERLKISYGIYLYSYATNEDEIYSEVDHTLRQIKKCGENFKLGVFLDMEDADSYKSKRNAINSKLLSELCYIFCYEISKLGIPVGIYSSKNWFENLLNDEKLDNYKKWLAHWSDKTDYNKDFQIWQFTSDYKINGKRFDANYLIKDYAYLFTKKPKENEENNYKIDTKEKLLEKIKEIEEIIINM